MRLGCQSLPICLEVVAPDDELDAFIRKVGFVIDDRPRPLICLLPAKFLVLGPG